MSENKGSTGRYALLAIVLPFIGVVIGAMLEHGTDGLCKLGIVDCRTSESEVTQLRSTVKGLQNSLTKAQQNHSTSQQNLKRTLGVLNSCQVALNESYSDIKTAGSNVETVEDYRSAFNTVTSKVETELDTFIEIIEEEKLATPEGVFDLKSILLEPLSVPLELKPLELKRVEVKPIEVKPLEIKKPERLEVKPIEIEKLVPLEVKPIELKKLEPVEIK